MVRELLEVFINHGERALEEGVKYLRHLRCDVHLQLVDERGHRGEHLGLPGSGHAGALQEGGGSVSICKYRLTN